MPKAYVVDPKTILVLLTSLRLTQLRGAGSSIKFPACLVSFSHHRGIADFGVPVRMAGESLLAREGEEKPYYQNIFVGTIKTRNWVLP